MAPLIESADGLANPVWSPDGSRMTANGPKGLYVFDPRPPWKQQQPQALPPPPGGRRLSVWSWSPDGTRLAGTTGVGERGDITIYAIKSRTYQTLTNFGYFPNDSIVFQSEGKLFLADHSKRVRELFAMPPDLIRTFDFSRDNRQLVFNRVVAEADVWLATLK